jgi:tRNA/rRNA methyltransferase
MPANNPPAVILVRPQMGENIGAVARAMSNFGLEELRIVAPRDGWPNPKAVEMAAGAEPIIANAQIYPDFVSSLYDVQLAFATTARPRDMEKRVLEPRAALAEVAGECAQGRKVALVFGPERTGLENEEVNRCDTLITIPTSEANRSINLAQCSVLVAYEWMYAGRKPDAVVRDLPDIAPHAEWEGLFGQLEDYLDAADYFRVAHKKPSMMQNLRAMLLRSRMSSQEVRTYRGMLRALWERRLNT